MAAEKEIPVWGHFQSVHADTNGKVYLQWDSHPLSSSHDTLTSSYLKKEKEKNTSNWLLSDSFIFLFFSMILIAASLYLPQHINFLTSRAWYYYHGHDIALTNSPDLAKTSEVIAQTVVESVKAAAGTKEL